MLSGSAAFFSLQEDYGDMDDRSRAYVLNGGQFREIKVGDIESALGMQAGLLQHFQWTRHCVYGRCLEGHFPTPSRSLEEVLDQSECMNLAGWFYAADVNVEFDSLLELFPDRRIAAISRASVGLQPYLFVGEEHIPPRDAIVPLLKASERINEGRGLLFLLRSGVMEQIAIYSGEGRVLAPVVIEELTYWDRVKFANENFGYDPR